VSDELKVGDRVIHPEYGAGLVLQIWKGRVVFQREEGGIVTVGLRSLTLELQAPKRS
jgi:hypothetical protein